MYKSKLVAGAGIAAVLLGLPAAAQSQEATSSDQGVNQIEDVVVTARRRSESLQEVPIAVSSLGGDVVREQNRNSVPDLITLIPTITLRPQNSAKDTVLLIRGLGTITTSPGAEPSVSMVLDGVVLARPGQMVSELVDLERIEVLRGPQGTLFGKNASAGVINIITANPTADTSAFIEASYYGGDEHRLTMGVNGEIIPGLLSGRLSGVTSGFKGDVRNIFLNETLSDRQSDGFRGKLLFTPNEDLSILVGADYLYVENRGNGGMYIATSTVAYPTGVRTQSAILPTVLQSVGITPGFRNRQVAQNTLPQFKDAFGGAVAQIDYRMGEFDLTAISGYRFWRSTQGGDLDGFATLTTATPTQQIDLGHVNSKQYTQEIRLASPKGGMIDYQIGVYYFRAVNREDYSRETTQLIAGNRVRNFGLNNFGTIQNNYSVFGEANVNFSEAFRAIAGVRLVKDKLSYYSDRVSTSAAAVPGILPAFAGKDSTSVTDYASRFGFQYDVSDDIHAYATYSRGYKGPAFNVFFNFSARETNTLKPETSDAFELGLKSSLLDRRLQVNVALFNDQVANFQANQPDLVAGTVVTRLINAGDVSTKGVEIEAIANVTNNLTISADYAYVKAKVDDFLCPVGAAVSCDIDGKPLPYAPKHKISVQAKYEAYDSERYRVNLTGNYTYQSSQQNSIAQTPDTIAPGYGIVNGIISVMDKKSGWEGRVLVRNLFDKFYRTTYAQGNGGLVGGLPRDYKRYFGVTVRKDF
ncbi:TonB-dependent receptor [Phenylobacterium sp.]|jgi:iron complex outermembrane receptor protein|uniref:TonB-dependent receptor n=1 Tax=Phenylobacterium sp. TaxID=1871053 RepID=UPI0037CA8D66